jgi:signal transduction histidine kinase
MTPVSRVSDSSRSLPETARILIVDDQPGNLEVASALLADMNVECVLARSADEALLALLDREFAAIVLDIRMPGMSGLELAELIKSRRRTRDVPILFLTAHMLDDRDVIRGYQLGAADYLAKPIQREVLRSKISVFVELYRRTRELAQANTALSQEVAERQRMAEELRLTNQDLERRVLERTEALEQADRRKDEFLASLAHELRNPLAPIRAAAELLRLENKTDATIARARTIIARQIEHMTRLVDDLLDVSRITSDKLKLRLASVRLSEVVAAAIETSQPMITERGHQLTVVLPNRDVVLDADLPRLSQALSNLLTNAAKYTAPGGDIRIVAEAQDDAVMLRVVDSGMGIEADVLPVIFDLFIQGDQPTDWTTSGLGIGLTLARRLVQMHGGTLEAMSAGRDQGSTFLLMLPLSKTMAASASTSSSNPADPAAESRRVLIVDDNEDAAEMLSVLVEAWGHSARVARDGIEAMDVARAYEPEFVLLDLGLPRANGFDVARDMRAEPWGRSARIIAVTGWGRDADKQRSRDAGFDEHLVKPVPTDHLKALLSQPPGRQPGRA